MARKKSPSTDSSSARSKRLRATPKDKLVALLDELAAKHPAVGNPEIRTFPVSPLTLGASSTGA